MYHAKVLNTPSAVDVLTDLVSDNQAALDELVSEEQLGLGAIAAALVDSPSIVDATYLNFLSAFCVCEGKAVREAQVSL